MILNLVKGIIFPSVTVLGFVGNISVFVNYMCSFGGGTEKKFIYLILIHLVFANIIVLLSKGMPKTIAALGLKDFLDDAGCKMVIYLDRMARGLSICTSSLLTVGQAIIISPRTSRWRRLKPRSAWHIFPLLLFLWILNSLISMNLLHSITSRSMNTSQPSIGDYYCYFLLLSQKTNWFFLTLMVLRDGVFQGVMGGASAYVVLLLHKHRQHVLYLQNSKFLYETPPEMKAAQSVLLLMLCFLLFYWTDCVFSLILNSPLENNPMMSNIQEFLTLGYATFSPFVLIHRDEHLFECWHVHWERKTLRKCLIHFSVSLK